ncbi:MAG: prepilin-type N-terminal cleavage/methylation domain-containing protein [Candidatus Omnitrophota bacterium]
MKVRKKGFTLLELLMVIMVIAILIGIALPRFRGMVEEGNVVKAKGELRTLQIAVENYYMHHTNAYPTAITGTTLTGDTPQIVSVLPTDPFNGASNYGYAQGGSKYYVIYSVGPANCTNATIDASTGNVTETGGNCIYVSNGQQDTSP